MTKTSRIPNRYAGPGAVAQTNGNLPLYRCNTCQAEVVWCESNRTGRRYLVNASTGFNGQRFYVGADIHTCKPEPTEADRTQSVWESMTGAERRAWMLANPDAEEFRL